MLREPVFYVGLAAGAVLAWLIAGRGTTTVTGAPKFPRSIRRTPRRGAAWFGHQRDTRPRGDVA